MKAKRKRRDRGVAIEMALAMLVLVFALCSLLVTLAAKSRSLNNRENTALTVSTAVDQLGEDFLSALAAFDATSGETFTFASTDALYDVRVSVDTDTYTLRAYSGNDQKLLVRAKKNADGSCTVLAWERP